MRMPFGKHRGVELRDLPDDYVNWLIGLDDLREPFRTNIFIEHDRRTTQQHDSSWSMGSGNRRQLVGEVQVMAQEIVSAGYRALSRRHHPDAGGSHEKMLLVNRAAKHLREVVL